MARKTRKPRTTRPAAASETDPQTIADAETVQDDQIEDAELADGIDAAATPDDTPEEADTLPEGADTSEGDATAPDDAAETTDARPAMAGDDSLAEDTAALQDPARDAPADLSEGVAPTEVPPLNDDTSPPETEEDLADLARLDGADPQEMTSGAAVDAAAPEQDISDDSAAPSAPPPATTTAPPQVIEQKGPGFVPLLLGGLVAGAIGYAIPTFLAPASETVAPADLAALEARIEALPSADAPDLSAVEAAQAEMSDRLDTLSARIDTLEGRPESAATQSAGASTAAPSGDAVAALRADVDALSSGTETDLDSLSDRIDTLSSGLDADLETLSARVDALAATVAALPAPPPDMTDRVAALEAELTALGEETEAVEISAEQRAREAAANQIRIAVDSGVPYAEPLAVVGGDVPAVLAENAETGLPTVAALADAFPEAARDALAEARRTAGDAGGLSAFIRRQTGARSLEPREGDDPDAVLSRAEAAIRAGDVDTALAEVETLPPEAQDTMSGWIADARTRADARAALSDYLGTE